jgi:hypothetical protein
VDKEGLANKRNAYFNTLFQNQNEPPAPNISTSQSSGNNNELLKNAFNAIKKESISNQRDENRADNYYNDKLKHQYFKNLFENTTEQKNITKADEFRKNHIKPMSEDDKRYLKDISFTAILENNFNSKFKKNDNEAKSIFKNLDEKLKNDQAKFDEELNRGMNNYNMQLEDMDAESRSVKNRKSTPMVYKKHQILRSESPFKTTDENLDFTEANRNISNPDDFQRNYENKTVSKKLINFYSPNKFAPLFNDDEEEAPQLLNQIKKQQDEPTIEELEKEFEALTESNNTFQTPKKDRTDEDIRKRRVEIFKSISRNEENKNKLQETLLEDSENLFGDKNYVINNYENDFQEFENYLQNPKNNLEGERKNKFIRYLKYYGKSRQGISGERVKNETAIQKLNAMRAEQAKLIENLPKS